MNVIGGAVLGAGIAVEVFVEEEVVAPRGIALEGAQTRPGGGTKMKHAVVGIRSGARIPRRALWPAVM